MQSQLESILQAALSQYANKEVTPDLINQVEKTASDVLNKFLQQGFILEIPEFRVYQDENEPDRIIFEWRK